MGETSNQQTNKQTGSDNGSLFECTWVDKIWRSLVRLDWSTGARTRGIDWLWPTHLCTRMCELPYSVDAVARMLLSNYNDVRMFSIWFHQARHPRTIPHKLFSWKTDLVILYAYSSRWFNSSLLSMFKTSKNTPVETGNISLCFYQSVFYLINLGLHRIMYTL